MKIRRLLVGIVGTNCYVAENPERGEALVIDPGDNAQGILELLEEDGMKPAAILLTHGHFDHCGAAETLASHYLIPVYCGAGDEDLIMDPEQNVSMAFAGRPIVCGAVTDWVRDGEKLELAGFEIQVLGTPGHTAGGVSYYFPTEKAVFSGDTLFFESVGRTDMPAGNTLKLIASIRSRLFSLPDDTQVLTGHGQSTSIGYEKRNNPYLMGQEY